MQRVSISIQFVPAVTRGKNEHSPLDSKKFASNALVSYHKRNTEKYSSATSIDFTSALSQPNAKNLAGNELVQVQ